MLYTFNLGHMFTKDEFKYFLTFLLGTLSAATPLNVSLVLTASGSDDVLDNL